MRFSVISYGSEGDTRPIAAVCRGLLDAGHDVHFFCEESSLPVVQAHGIPAEALPGGIMATLPLDNPAADLVRRDVFKAAKASVRLVNDHMERWTRRLTDHAASAHAILFSGLTMLLGPAVAQALDKPAINLALQPLLGATREFPSAMLPPWSLPGWMNRLTYPFAYQVLERLYGKSTDEAMRHVFGRTAPARQRHRGPVLYGFSRFLVPRPADWPTQHRICGAWTFPVETWTAPPEILDFLAAGAPPLYVGFGALSSFVRHKQLSELVAAVGGRRALFYPGWSRIDQSMLPDNFRVIGHTEHATLFPRMSMVIHHGGAGTTHTAAGAGVPSVVTPFGVDQFFWARRLAVAGVAHDYVRPAQLNRTSLRQMMDFAETDLVRGRAQALASEMAAEDGVRQAVDAIVSHAGSATAAT